MRSVDAIRGEIGQLKHSIEKRKERISALRDELAERELTERGFLIGQTVEVPWGSGKRSAIVIMFSAGDLGSLLWCQTIKKDGSRGAAFSVKWCYLDGVVIVEHPK